MSEDVASTPPPPAAPAAPPRRWRKWLLIIGLGVIILPATALALWSWFAVSWTYSDGLRSGYVQKFSRKGWLCKTWEGELAMVNIPGAAQERWTFSVRNDSVARVIENAMGQQMTLHYEEKRGIPTSCFGETNYFVTGAQPVGAPQP